MLTTYSHTGPYFSWAAELKNGVLSLITIATFDSIYNHYFGNWPTEADVRDEQRSQKSRRAKYHRFGDEFAIARADMHHKNDVRFRDLEEKISQRFDCVTWLEDDTFDSLRREAELEIKRIHQEMKSRIEELVNANSATIETIGDLCEDHVRDMGGDEHLCRSGTDTDDRCVGFAAKVAALYREKEIRTVAMEDEARRYSAKNCKVLFELNDRWCRKRTHRLTRLWKEYCRE